MRRRAAKARLEREEARQRRWRALATPTAKPSRTAAANCEQLVIAEYADGWRHCCQWAVGSAPPTAAQVRGASPYWFNVRSGESRWTPPPSLSLESRAWRGGDVINIQKPSHNMCFGIRRRRLGGERIR